MYSSELETGTLKRKTCRSVKYCTGLLQVQGWLVIYSHSRVISLPSDTISPLRHKIRLSQLNLSVATMMRPSMLTKVRAASHISCRSRQPARQLFLFASRVPPPITASTASSSLPLTQQHHHHHQQQQPLRPRHFTTSIANMSNNPQPRFPAGSDAAALEPSLAPLLTANGGRWSLTASGEGLEREFKFKTFAKTWACPSSPVVTTANSP